MKQINYQSFKSQHIYVGLDVHYKSWTVGIQTENSSFQSFSQDPKPEILVKYLKKNFPGCIYHTVYEAGFSGFWIHDYLKSKGIDSIVINPADVPTTNKERDRKTDKVDAAKLARSLKNGELVAIYVHSKDMYEDRMLIRARESMVKDQTRIKNRIKGLMKFFGIEITKEQAKTHWSRKYIELLSKTEIISHGAKTSLDTYIGQLISQRKLICDLTREIRKLSREDKYKEIVKYLESIPGISTLSAMILLTEIGDINRFKNLDKFLGYIGLIPSEHSSGEKENKQYMTRRGNSLLKRVIIECSWVAIRKDPALAIRYNQLCREKRGSRAIITISKKFASRIMHVMKNRVEYKFIEVK
jgi:transposase